MPGPSNLSILGLDIPLACDPAEHSGGPYHVTLALSLLATALAAAAQPAGKAWRVGYLVAGTGRVPEAFQQGLRDLGYVD